MWNLETKTNKMKMDSYREQTGGRQKVGGVVVWVKEVKGSEVQTSSYTVSQSQGCNIQHKEYGQQYCNKSVWRQTLLDK